MFLLGSRIPGCIIKLSKTWVPGALAGRALAVQAQHTSEPKPHTLYLYVLYT